MLYYVPMKMRIQKYLSQEGILSRRQAESAILAGWIKVNGKVVTELGTQIDPNVDRVVLDDGLAERRKQVVYLAVNKPKGVVTNCPQKDEKQVIDILPKRYKHLHSVGRLDKDSEGLILMSDDGVFAREMLSQDEPHAREYLVWTSAPIGYAEAQVLMDEGMVAGKVRQSCEVRLLGDNYFKITLTEGKNRQIRRMVQQLGCFVVKLRRIRFGTVELGDLSPGGFRELTRKEVRMLRESRLNLRG